MAFLAFSSDGLEIVELLVLFSVLLLMMVLGYAIIAQRSMVGLAAALGTHTLRPCSAVWSRVETHVRRVLKLQG